MAKTLREVANEADEILADYMADSAPEYRGQAMSAAREEIRDLAEKNGFTFEEVEAELYRMQAEWDAANASEGFGF